MTFSCDIDWTFVEGLPHFYQQLKDHYNIYRYDPKLRGFWSYGDYHAPLVLTTEMLDTLFKNLNIFINDETHFTMNRVIMFKSVILTPFSMILTPFFNTSEDCKLFTYKIAMIEADLLLTRKEKKKDFFVQNYKNTNDI